MPKGYVLTIDPLLSFFNDLHLWFKMLNKELLARCFIFSDEIFLSFEDLHNDRWNGLIELHGVDQKSIVIIWLMMNQRA